MIDNSGFLTRYEYDTNHNLVRVEDSENGITSFKDGFISFPNDTFRKIEFDNQGNIIKIIDGFTPHE